MVSNEEFAPSVSVSESREIYLVGGLSIVTGAVFALLAALLPLPFYSVVALTFASLAIIKLTKNSTLFWGMCSLVVAGLCMRHPYFFAMGWGVSIGLLLFSDLKDRSRLQGVHSTTDLLCAVSSIVTTGMTNVIDQARSRIGPAKAFLRTEFNNYRGITFSTTCSTSCAHLRAYMSRFVSWPPLPVSPPPSAPVETTKEKQHSKACGGKQTSGELTISQTTSESSPLHEE